MKGSAPVFLALITSAGFFFCIGYMLIWTFPEANKDALNSLLGVLTTIFTLQMNYFFGSTSSSKAKDDTIRDVAVATSGAANGTQQTPIPVKDMKVVAEGDVSITTEKTI